MNRENFSLLHPQNTNVTYRTLNTEAQNDLSVDFICEALTKDPYEQNNIRELLIKIPDSAEV